MPNSDEKRKTETDAAFAFTLFMINVLIFLVMCGSVWMMQFFVLQSGQFSLFLRDYTIYK